MNIFIVLKNSDFTEGKGTMNLHKLFHSLESARNYVKKQDGIFGSKQYEEPRESHIPNIMKPLVYLEYWNGYWIQEFQVEE